MGYADDLSAAMCPTLTSLMSAAVDCQQESKTRGPAGAAESQPWMPLPHRILSPRGAAAVARSQHQQAACLEHRRRWRSQTEQQSRYPEADSVNDTIS